MLRLLGGLSIGRTASGRLWLRLVGLLVGLIERAGERRRRRHLHRDDRGHDRDDSRRGGAAVTAYQPEAQLALRTARNRVGSCSARGSLVIGAEAGHHVAAATHTASDVDMDDFILGEVESVETDGCAWQSTIGAGLRVRRVGEHREPNSRRRSALFSDEHDGLLALEGERDDHRARVLEGALGIGLGRRHRRSIGVVQEDQHALVGPEPGPGEADRVVSLESIRRGLDLRIELQDQELCGDRSLARAPHEDEGVVTEGGERNLHGGPDISSPIGVERGQRLAADRVPVHVHRLAWREAAPRPSDEIAYFAHHGRHLHERGACAHGATGVSQFGAAALARLDREWPSNQALRQGEAGVERSGLVYADVSNRPSRTLPLLEHQVGGGQGIETVAVHRDGTGRLHYAWVHQNDRPRKANGGLALRHHRRDAWVGSEL